MQHACEMVQALLKTQQGIARTPYNEMCVQILSVLQKQGYIRGFTAEGHRLNILLKHYHGGPVIRNVRVVSKPSRDIWVHPYELKAHTAFNTGLWLIQTPYGILSHRDCLEMGIGGKVIFAINNGHQHWC